MFNFFKRKKDSYYQKLIKSNNKSQYNFNSKYRNQESKLLKIYGKCGKINGQITILLITDTHGYLKEKEFSEFILKNNNYDICLLLGDHSSEDVKIVLKYVKREKIYALLGNHDNDYITQFDLNNLNGNVIEINGIKLLGIQGSYRYKPGDFPSFSQEESLEFLEGMPKIDILVCHDSPFELSQRNDVAHQGLFGITYYLYKNKVPYCIHGHLHTKYSKQMSNGTVVNCYYMYDYIKIN